MLCGKKGLFIAVILFTSFQSIAQETVALEAVVGKTIPVTVKSFGQLAIYPVVVVPASVVSLNNSKISSEVNAIINEIPVNVGQVVERDAVLLELDTDIYQLEYNRARAVLQSIEAKRDLATYQLQRSKRLLKQKVVSEELLKQKQSDVKVLKAEYTAQKSAVKIAKHNLDRCTIRAPFKAIIKQRIAHVGELASRGKSLINIIDAEQLEISAKIQANDINSLKSTDVVELISQGERYYLKIFNITPAYDKLERSQEVRFKFLGEPDLPGSFGKIRWKKSVAHIPADLVVRRQGDLGIFVVNENKAKFLILTNAKEGQPVEMTQLPEATSVIVDGRYKLRDGNDVRIQ